MNWYELEDARGPKLDELAKQYDLHPLHIEDCRTPDERVKVDIAPHYTFAVLKALEAPKGEGDLQTASLFVFAGRFQDQDFCITIGDQANANVRAALDHARREGSGTRPGRILYLVFDSLVDSYFAQVDVFDDRIDALEDRVIGAPGPEVLIEVFDLKRDLVDIRRVLVNTRDASLRLQSDAGSVIDAEHRVYIRDIYDHIVRLLDTVETQRDLLNNTLDIYLSSVANRTNETMKVLTVLGTVALPALLVTSMYGMNVKGLPFANSTHGAAAVAGLTAVFTGALLLVLRKFGWL